MNIRSLLQLFVIIILIALIVSLALQLIQGDNATFSIPPSLPSRSVMELTLPLHEEWRIPNVFLPYHTVLPSGVYANENHVFFVTSGPDLKARSLHVLAPKTGSLLWEAKDLPYPENSFTADQKRLYLALSRQIRAYDLYSGELLWTTQEELPGHAIYWLYLIGDNLFVVSEEDALAGRQQVIRSYNAQSGLPGEVERIEVPHNAHLVLRTSSNDFWTDGKSLWATDRSDRQSQWTLSITDPLQHQPLLINSQFVFASGIFSDVFGVDSVTGIQSWKYERRIVSNLAAVGEIIYAIREDATLVGINASTGDEIGHIAFSRATTESGTRSTTYWVAATGSAIYVYFGDSHELIAFTK